MPKHNAMVRTHKNSLIAHLAYPPIDGVNPTTRDEAGQWQTGEWRSVSAASGTEPRMGIGHFKSEGRGARSVSEMKSRRGKDTHHAALRAVHETLCRGLDFAAASSRRVGRPSDRGRFGKSKSRRGWTVS